MLSIQPRALAMTAASHDCSGADCAQAVDEPSAAELRAWHCALGELVDAGSTPIVPLVVARALWWRVPQLRPLLEQLNRLRAVAGAWW